MINFLNTGYISKKTLLVLNYSKLNINEKQLAIILLIMELSNDEQKNFTPSELAKHMTISKEEIEKEISLLLKHHLIKIENKAKKTILDLTPMFYKIIYLLEQENSKLSEDLEFKFIEKFLSIELSKDQIEYLESFEQNGISKSTMLSLIHTNNIKTFSEFIKVLKDRTKQVKIQLTKYNWLND